MPSFGIYSGSGASMPTRVNKLIAEHGAGQGFKVRRSERA